MYRKVYDAVGKELLIPEEWLKRNYLCEVYQRTDGTILFDGSEEIMRQYIDGLMYDTSRSRLICTVKDEHLYLTLKGRTFLYWDEGKIKVIDKDEAINFMLKAELPMEKIKEIFNIEDA